MTNVVEHVRHFSVQLLRLIRVLALSHYMQSVPEAQIIVEIFYQLHIFKFLMLSGTTARTFSLVKKKVEQWCHP